jgi:hypothetical protein
MSLIAAVKIGDSLQQGLDAFFAFLPNLLGFLTSWSSATSSPGSSRVC